MTEKVDFIASEDRLTLAEYKEFLAKFHNGIFSDKSLGEAFVSEFGSRFNILESMFEDTNDIEAHMTIRTRYIRHA